MNYPKISIVTPSYNQGAFLEETMRAVLEQGYPNLEYIVIDGGSTDNSVEIIKKYEKQLAYWVSEKDNGMYDAIQKGLSRATGDVMGWINSDDGYHRKALFVVGEVFQNIPEISWLQGNPSSMDEQGRMVSSFSSRRWSRYHFYMGDYKFVQQESTFWRKSLWDLAGGTLRTDMKLAGDFELWLRFMKYAKLHVLRAPVGIFRLRSGNQLSLDRIEDYNKECLTEIKAVVEKLSDAEKNNLAYLKKYWSIYSKIPLMKSRAKEKFDAILDLPADILFDRKLQKFYLQKAK